jgi:FADH2 O2-dependent halogenase
VNRRRFQILVVGSGFSGSLGAMIARRLGYSTLLLERWTHPRFAIGESSTPLANLLLEEIASQYDLPGLLPLCKWGAWQANAPQLACGLKRGFTFYHHELGRPFEPDPDRERQLLVGANPCDEIADTHWYRADFDHYLVRQAQTLGVDYLDQVELLGATPQAGGMRLRGKRHDQSIDFVADFVIDATGPRGFLHRALSLQEKTFTAMPPTQALFSHFKNVVPLPDSFCVDGLTPPYPVEDAAVHHIFDGGWIWVLRFNNGVTSAGVALTDPLANAVSLQSGEPAWLKLLAQLPSLATSFRRAASIRPFVFMPRVAFQSHQVAGLNWALLPSAAGVVDPLLSTGFPLTLLGVARIGAILKHHWHRPSFEPALADYARLTTLELETTARLVGALYRTMHQFERFKALTLLYFAAASYSETARRLGKEHLDYGFLLCSHPHFSRKLHQICRLAFEGGRTVSGNGFKKLVNETIGPFDLAGLSDVTRHPWYPARPEDVLASADKVGADHDEVITMLRKCRLITDHDACNHPVLFK